MEPEKGSPWQEQTVVTGRALGRVAQAEQLVADVEARFAEAAEEHPEFAEATATRPPDDLTHIRGRRVA